MPKGILKTEGPFVLNLSGMWRENLKAIGRRRGGEVDMHWFKRLLIAIVVGWMCRYPLNQGLRYYTPQMRAMASLNSKWIYIYIAINYSIPVIFLLITVLTYAYLTRRYYKGIFVLPRRCAESVSTIFVASASHVVQSAAREFKKAIRPRQEGEVDMHWFTRLIIAIAVGWICWNLSNRGINYAFQNNLISLSPGTTSSLLLYISFDYLITVPYQLAALLTYAYLTRRFYKGNYHITETYCRKCQGILRGIAEPRCPECGERI